MSGKRVWRKLIKKQQRKRRRQKHAQERDKQQALEDTLKENDPEYQQWLKQQTELENFNRLTREREQQVNEEAWLRREALAQRQFQLDAAKRLQQDAAIEQLRARQAEELATVKQEQLKRRDERARLTAQAAAEFETMMQQMHKYMEATDDCSPPAELQRIVETYPAERLCEFFTRTNSCRFGYMCTFNHKRPMLAKIILIRHFFTHPLLQTESTHKEYAEADEHLELTDRDLRADYDEFFGDVVPELERFGKVINFRALCNTLPHLRGHVFVEYAHERSALRAFINLQGRYYASKRLNVEFSNLNGWRGAVCGLSLTRKCPKGSSCCYLHLFRNPENLFNENLEYHRTPRSSRQQQQQGNKTPIPKTPSWNDNEQPSRNWRWSESPELEISSLKAHKTPKSKSSAISENRSKASKKIHSRHSSRELSGNHNRRSSKSSCGRIRSRSRHSRSPHCHRKINQNIV